MIGQLIYSSILKTKSRILEILLCKMRGILIGVGFDPIITLSYRNFILSMPFSHTLPLIQKKFPNYNVLLCKIVNEIIRKEGQVKMIDVGANIGDTVVYTNCKGGDFLLIEGEEKYNVLIQKNLIQNNFILQNIIIENIFIGDSSANFASETKDGSSILVSNNDNGFIKTQTLDFIVEKNRFQPNFIKIDTDGFDFKVIRSAKETIIKYKPLILFEWDKNHLANQNEDPLSIFSLLWEMRYETLIIFDNFGNLLCELKIDDWKNLQLLIDYPERSNNNIYYYDILVIPCGAHFDVSRAFDLHPHSKNR